jgi:hypothetical protein
LIAAASGEITVCRFVLRVFFPVNRTGIVQRPSGMFLLREKKYGFLVFCDVGNIPRYVRFFIDEPARLLRRRAHDDVFVFRRNVFRHARY